MDMCRLMGHVNQVLPLDSAANTALNHPICLARAYEFERLVLEGLLSKTDHVEPRGSFVSDLWSGLRSRHSASQKQMPPRMYRPRMVFALHGGSLVDFTRCIHHVIR